MNRHSEAREFTRRSLLTGVLIGAVLTPCNVYSGLKIGWSFNMSIVAALLAYGFWNLGARRLGARPFGLLENNINQTTASSAASIISGGLVAPIPALALITGQTLPWHWLAVWVCVVSLLGVCVAVALRRQLLLVEQLSFPAGVATAETVREIYGRGAEAVARVRVLLASLALSGAVKLLTSLGGIAAVPLGFRLAGQGAVAGRTLGGGSLGFAFDPSLLLVGFGAIIGLRAGVSLLLGAMLAWGLMAPWLLARGWVDATGALTAAGADEHDEIERLTDRAAARPWGALGPERTAELAALLVGSHHDHRFHQPERQQRAGVRCGAERGGGK